MKRSPLHEKDWKLYLSRPFDLFETSLWDDWYTSPLLRKMIGVSMSPGLFLEHDKGLIRHYRKKDSLGVFFEGYRNLSKKSRTELISLLKRGVELNEKAVRIIQKKDTRTFPEAVEFLIENAHYATILPHWLGEHVDQSDTELWNLIRQLQSVSLYPRMVKEVIRPLALTMLPKGVTDAHLSFLTLDEVKRGDIEQLPRRLEETKQGRRFVYWSDGKTEEVEWHTNLDDFVKGFGELSEGTVREIKGQIAQKGKARGVARIVHSNDPGSVVFLDGEVLVTSSTNPNLLPIMKKACAFVTDEGGVTSHAAIVSRELGIPCVIGTKIATQVIKTGDMLEVDADVGIVRILSQ